MIPCYTDSQNVTPITVVNPKSLTDWYQSQNDSTVAWLKSNHFAANTGSVCLLPGAEGQLEKVLVGCDDLNDMWALADIPAKLPKGNYQFDASLDPSQLYFASIAWGLHCYQFTRYKKSDMQFAQLKLSDSLDQTHIENIIKAIYQVRDLINTPTEDLGPEQLSEAAKSLANTYQAKFSEVVGDDLLTENYPAIHAVGRASQSAPRLLKLTWGDNKHPKVVLVGKGVCFDTGGLDIKNSQGMRLMKKDMGGAAHALGLAQLIMAEQLPIQLTVLIPAVENAVAGNAYRPGDVIPSRKGLSIEIGNTDGEGRVVLADALVDACAIKPEVIIDFATLTGAARIAMGADVPAFFTNDDQLAADLMVQGKVQNDPIWQLPLYKPYRGLIDSPIADISNSGSTGYGGAITAALFLQEFVGDVPWVHFDMMAWNTSSRPGRPEGGEAMALRTVFHYLLARYSKN